MMKLITRIKTFITGCSWFSKAASIFSTKNIIIGLISIISVLYFLNWRLESKIDNLNSLLSIEQTENIRITEELIQANLHIDNQNVKITEMKLDVKQVEKDSNEKEKQLIAKHYEELIKIKMSIDKDSSSDNQLKLIDDQLRRFSNDKK